MNPSDPVYIVTYFAMIIFFTYFYVAVTFNPQERADDMKKYGGFILVSVLASRPPTISATSCPGSRFPARSTSV